MPDVNKISAESAAAYQRTQEARHKAAARTARSSGGAAPEPGARPDSVALSPSAQELRRLTAAVMAAPDVRDERVAALREQVEAGTYPLPSDEALAEAMLRGG